MKFYLLYLRHKKLISNFSYLAILQLITLFLPLLMYPYLIRVLGTDVYGKVIYSQAIIAYFSIIINYGFNISATKDVSINRDDKERLSEIISSVFFVKLFLWAVSFCCILMLILLVEKFRDDYVLYLLTFGVCFYELFFQQFFFQGIEEMKYITLINAFSRISCFILVFVFVNECNDYLLVPLLNTLGGIIGGAVTFYIIYVKKGIKLRLQPICVILNYFNESTPFFLSRFSSVVVHRTNTVLIGSFIGYVEVSYYDLAQKILTVMLIPFDLLNQVLYPNVARNKNMYLVKKIILLSLVICVFMYVSLLIFQYPIIKLLAGVELLPAIPLIDLLCISIFILSTSYFLGNTMLVVMGYAKLFNRSVVDTSIIYLVLVLLLLVFRVVNVYSLVIISLMVDLLCMLYRFVSAYKYKLL